jgi:hypothetical protein
MLILDLNVFPMRAPHPSERPTNTKRRACATTPRNTTTIFLNKRYRILLFRFFAIFYIPNFYLTRAEVVSNLAIIATVPLSAHPLCRRFAILITTTLFLSN